MKRMDKRGYHSKWREASRDHIREYNRRYRDANRDRVREWNRKYYASHRDKAKEYNRRHREARREYMKEWHAANRDRYAEYNKKYSKTEKGRAVIRRVVIKECNRRRRDLGTNPISFMHAGCHWHHVNVNDVVACPSHIHDHFYHSLKDGSALRIEGVLG